MVACLVADGGPAVTQEIDPDPAGDQSLFDNLAVILVIDISGSMSYTDPLRLRETAAGMFIDLLGADDYLGVITFDDQAELVSPLSPSGSPSAKEALAEKLFPRLDPRGDTDFIEALTLAHRQFADTDTGDRIPVILLLTDGDPDPYPGSLEDEEFMSGYMESLWEKVDLLAQDEILVYTVGFSDEIDPEILTRIATATRGHYYILQEPADLLLAFYQALEALKDRRSFINETIDLGSGGSQTFSFDLKEYMRQMNLVLVSAGLPGEADFGAVVKPPRGGAEDIDELIVGGRDNYLTVIISRPLEEHYGTWDVEVTGSGEITVLGNADLYLEARLIDPDPSAHYPLDEPMEITLEVITREKYAGALFNPELQVKGPDDAFPVVVPLTGEGNLYRGVYEYVDRAGDYELSWHLYSGEEIIYSSEEIITVSLLPALTSDFWVDSEGLRLGEEMVVSAWLATGGERLQQGPHLQIDSINLSMEFRDGARIEKGLFDSGEHDHGNSRAGDGIWSNRLLFDREGAARVLLTANGSYHGAGFVLKKSFGITVAEPGQVTARLSSEGLWSRAGEKLSLPFIFENESPFTQTLRLSTPSDELTLLQDRIILPPGEITTVNVESEISGTTEPGSFYMTVHFEPEDKMTLVQPDEVDFELQVLSLWAAFVRRFSGVGAGLGITLAAFLLLAGIIFGGGNLLNRYYLQPRLKLGGQLEFYTEDDNPGGLAEKKQFIDLSQAAKDEVVILLGSETDQADFKLDQSSAGYDMIISNCWNDNLPRFLRGWKALFKRSLVIETVIHCTPPGILLFNDKVYSRRELHDGDQFKTGGYIFKYKSRPDKSLSGSARGVDILNGKM